MYTIQRWYGSSYSITTNDYGILKLQISKANILSPSSSQFRLHMWNRIHCHNVNCICCRNHHICMRHHKSYDRMRDLNTLLIRMLQMPVMHMTMNIRYHNSHHGSRSRGNHDLKSNYDSVNF